MVRGWSFGVHHIWYFVWWIHFHCKSRIDVCHLNSSEAISRPYTSDTIMIHFFVIMYHGLLYQKPLRNQEIHQQYIPPFLKILIFHPVKPGVPYMKNVSFYPSRNSSNLEYITSSRAFGNIHNRIQEFKNFIGVTMTGTCLTNTHRNNNAQGKKDIYTEDTPHKTIYKTILLNHMAAFRHRKWYTRISLILCTCWRERENGFLIEYILVFYTIQIQNYNIF